MRALLSRLPPLCLGLQLTHLLARAARSARQGQSAEQLDQDVEHQGGQPLLLARGVATRGRTQGGARAQDGRGERFPVQGEPATPRKAERERDADPPHRAQVYGEFDKDYGTWLQVVKSLAELDCLMSLSKSSQALGEPAVRPEIVESDQAVIEFEELRHPCVLR